MSTWLVHVVRGTVLVFDVTPMLATQMHPAGIQILSINILRNGGTDATSHFDFHSKAATKLFMDQIRSRSRDRSER